MKVMLQAIRRMGPGRRRGLHDERAAQNPCDSKGFHREARASQQCHVTCLYRLSTGSGTWRRKPEGLSSPSRRAGKNGMRRQPFVTTSVKTKSIFYFPPISAYPHYVDKKAFSEIKSAQRGILYSIIRESFKNLEVFVTKVDINFFKKFFFLSEFGRK